MFCRLAIHQEFASQRGLSDFLVTFFVQCRFFFGVMYGGVAARRGPPHATRKKQGVDYKRCDACHG